MKPEVFGAKEMSRLSFVFLIVTGLRSRLTSERRLGASPRTVIWTLPGTFGHQQTNCAELGDAAAQQSANFVVEVALRSIAASQLSYSLAMRKIIFDPQAPRD